MSRAPIDYMPAFYERALAQREEQIAAWRKQDDENELRSLQMLGGVMFIGFVGFVVIVAASI